MAENNPRNPGTDPLKPTQEPAPTLQPRTNIPASQKRTITPSAQESEAKRPMPQASNPGQSSGSTSKAAAGGFPETIRDPYTTEKGVTTSVKEQMDAGASDIVLPAGFDIRDPRNVAGVDPRYALIADIFAGLQPAFIQNASHEFLRVYVNEFPGFSLPLTVGGVPLLLVSTRPDQGERSRAVLWPRGVPGHDDVVTKFLVPEVNAMDGLSDAQLKYVSAKVAAHWRKTAGVGVRHVMFTRSDEFFIVFSRGTSIPNLWHQLVGIIANCEHVRCFTEDTFPSISDPSMMDAARTKNPDPTPGKRMIDDTAYKVMRPGVLAGTLANGKLGDVRFTTGVKLRDPADGTILITTPTHCIAPKKGPKDKETPPRAQGICMPNQKGTPCLAHVKYHSFLDTDITFAELSKDVTFYNTTFSTPFADGIKLQKLRTEHDTTIQWKVFLDSCFTGRISGTVEAQHVTIREMPALGVGELDELGIGQNVEMVCYNWMWYGQDHYRVRPGTYGTPVVAKDGTVLGLFYLAIKHNVFPSDPRVDWRGFALSVSSSELSSRGFKLVVETELSDT